MRDADGVEWLTVPQAAERFEVRPSLLYGWVKKGRVEAHTADVMMVRVPDVAEAEHAWRTRRKGHPRRATVQVLATTRSGE